MGTSWMRLTRWLFVSLVSLGVASPGGGAERRKVIIDQDAFGGPGLQPILMLLQDPTVEVLGIAIVSGDGWEPEETAETLRMLELIGRADVPVVEGAIYPLVNSKERNKRREALCGALGYKGAWTDHWPSDNTMKRRDPHDPRVVPPLEQGMPTTRPYPGSAADFLLDVTRRYPGEVTIIAMGPLTNLALAQRLDDDFAGRVKELVVEGGNLIPPDIDKKQDQFAMQGLYAPRMSFNYFWDPEAAHIVFTSKWGSMTLVTASAHASAVGTRELLARATASVKPVARYVSAAAQPGFPLWDEVEAAAWLDPAIVTRTGRLAMDVDLMPGANYGALLTWAPGQGPGLGEQDVRVVFAVDVAKVETMFVELLGR